MTHFIRDAEITDIEHLREVFRSASLSNENDRTLLQEHPEWLELSTEGLLDGRTRVAVGGNDDAPVAFATFVVIDGIAELEDLFVDPRWMRRGVGAALVEDMAARLNDLGFDSLEVTANPHARAFYECVGFVEDRIVDTQGYPAARMIRPTGSFD